jgi:predicted MFS family arabinose efflux permease
MPEQAPSTTQPLAWRQVLLMALSCALAVSTIYYHQPLLPQMASSLGVTVTHGSLIATLTQLGYAAGLLLFVPLGDGIQPRKLASLAIGANAVALVACAVAPTFPLLAGCSFLVGMTAVTAQIIIPAVSGQTTPDRRGRVVGSLLGGLSSGVLLARTVSGVVGAYLGWRAIFVFASAVDLVLLVIINKYLPLSTSLSTIRYRDLIRSLTVLMGEERLLRISAATSFLLFAAFSALWATLASLLARPPYEFGTAAIGAFGLVGVLSLPVSAQIGAIADRIGTRSMASFGAITVTMAFAFVAAGGVNLSCLIVGMVLLDLGNRAALVANQARIYALRPEARSRLNTLLMVSYFLGGASGAALGSLGAHFDAWIGLAAVGAMLSLAAAAVNALSHKQTSPALVEERA